MAQEGWKLEQEESACSPTPEAPKLCSNNCGFFGSSATMNLCSSCYRDLVLLKPISTTSKTLENTDPQQKTPTVSEHEGLSVSSTKPDTNTPSSSSSSSSTSSSSTASSDALNKGSGSTSTSVRCFACNKKVGLRGFKCRCGDTFCSVHRYNDKHNCSFDYKAAGRAAIASANPVVKAQKLHKI